MRPGSRVIRDSAIEFRFRHMAYLYSARSDSLNVGDLLGRQGRRGEWVRLCSAHGGWTGVFYRTGPDLCESLPRCPRPAAGGPARVGLALRAAIPNIWAPRIPADLRQAAAGPRHACGAWHLTAKQAGGIKLLGLGAMLRLPCYSADDDGATGGDERPGQCDTVRRAPRGARRAGGSVRHRQGRDRVGGADAGRSRARRLAAWIGGRIPGSRAPEGLQAPPAAVCSIDAAARRAGAGLRVGVDRQVPLGSGLG